MFLLLRRSHVICSLNKLIRFSRKSAVFKSVQDSKFGDRDYPALGEPGEPRIRMCEVLKTFPLYYPCNNAEYTIRNFNQAQEVKKVKKVPSQDSLQILRNIECNKRFRYKIPSLPVYWLVLHKISTKKKDSST